MRSRWITGGNSCTILYQNCGDAQGKHEPGKERPVQASEVYDRQIRHISRGCDVERMEVVKHIEFASRKAAIVCIVPVP